jgi:hypothetical protein
MCERVLLIGTRFSNLYTAVDTPAKAACIENTFYLENTFYIENASTRQWIRQPKPRGTTEYSVQYAPIHIESKCVSYEEEDTCKRQTLRLKAPIHIESKCAPAYT